MKFSVTGKQMDVGAALQQHVEQTMHEVVSTYFKSSIDGSVTFWKERHLFHCEIGIHVGRSMFIHGQGRADDAYVAFDQAKATVEGRLRKYKSRIRDHHRGKKTQEMTQSVQQYVLNSRETQDEDATEDLAPLIVAENRTNISSLSVKDAVMLLDLGNQPVLLFKNAAHKDRLNIVYKRDDGNVGWIDPEV